MSTKYGDQILTFSFQDTDSARPEGPKSGGVLGEGQPVPLHQLGGVEERCELPKGVRGRALAAQRFSYISSALDSDETERSRHRASKSPGSEAHEVRQQDTTVLLIADTYRQGEQACSQSSSPPSTNEVREEAE